MLSNSLEVSCVFIARKSRFIQSEFKKEQDLCMVVATTIA